MLAPFKEMMRRDGNTRRDMAKPRHALLYGKQPFGVAKRQRAHEYGVGDAEDRGVGGDAQRNNQDHHCAEAGISAERPQAVAEIGPDE